VSVGKKSVSIPFTSFQRSRNAVSIPFTEFTDFWDPSTGKPIHTCAEDARYCPDKKTLTNMQSMSFWAEGVEGDIHLEIESVSACGCK
jgi:hypothetical protein